jgi:6-phosphofructokinase 1
MKRQGMFVEGLFEVPEVRTIVPSHLVRSGFTSAYDANFGMSAGANAVILLLRGISGVTVSGYQKGTVYYMEIKEAIKQRNVDLDDVAVFEQLGFCFGRVREEFEPKVEMEKRFPQRIY